MSYAHNQMQSSGHATGSYALIDATSNRGYSESDTDADATQPNTANPFKKNIIDIVHAKNVPSAESLESLLGCLANAEDKLHAIACGLIPACFKIYDSCHHTPETESVRHVLVRMLRSFVILSKGRSVLLESVGTARVLALLNDPSAPVRIQVCTMLAVLTSFPDVKSPVKEGRAILLAVVNTFLKDPSQEVTDAAIPALQQLTLLDPLLDEATLTKLSGVIVRTSPSSSASSVAQPSDADRIALALLKQTLQVVWNCSLHSTEKDLAIKVGLVSVIVPLLEDGRPLEIVRCASGVLAALSIAQAGKLAIIAHPGAVAQACKLTLDKRAAEASDLGRAVRKNAVSLVRNFTESPTGLSSVGKFLLPEPEALLEVLGCAQAAAILAPRFSGLDHASTRATLDPIDLLWSVRALQTMMKTGKPGLDAAWRILDIVPRLYQCVVFNPPSAAATNKANNSASLQETLTSIRGGGNRCLLLLCEANDDARVELLALGAKLPPSSVSSSSIFASVASSHLQARQAQQAKEAKEREEQEQRRREEQERERRRREEEAAMQAVLEQERLERERAEAAAEAGVDGEAPAADGTPPAQAEAPLPKPIEA
jgi:hypothetical protein